MGWLGQVGWRGSGLDGMDGMDGMDVVADPMPLRVGTAAQCKVCSPFVDVRFFSSRLGAFREVLIVW